MRSSSICKLDVPELISGPRSFKGKPAPKLPLQRLHRRYLEPLAEIDLASAQMLQYPLILDIFRDAPGRYRMAHAVDLGNLCRVDAQSADLDEIRFEGLQFRQQCFAAVESGNSEVAAVRPESCHEAPQRLPIRHGAGA